MRKVKLTKEEQAIENTLDEFVPVSREEYNAIAHAITVRKKDAVLNIRVNSNDLKNIKQKASQLGIKYQTFISELLHRTAQAS